MLVNDKNYDRVAAPRATQRRAPSPKLRKPIVIFGVAVVCLVPARMLRAQSSDPQYGQMVLGQGALVNPVNLTLPRGGVWLNGNLGGHWWQTDGTTGICRVEQPAGAPPSVGNCQATAASGGQAIVASKIVIGGATTVQPGQVFPPQAGSTVTTYVFVPDDSSKSTRVVRYVFDPVKETLSGALPITVPNSQFAGGGSQGGRPVAVALAPNGTDMYVGYIKSGDIVKLKDPMLITSGAPPACASAGSGQCYTIVGATSDGRKGVNSMAMFRNDLYLAETGGPFLTVIQDPSGVTRPGCTSTSKCSAVIPPNLPQGVPAFPGGMASDGTYLYIGDAPLNGTPGIGIVRWNVTSGQVSTVSQNIRPSYTGTVDGTVFNSYSQYASPIGIGVALNGDLYVADDPSFTCAGPTCPAAGPPVNQGHLWRVPFVPAPPTITGISPNTGVPEGGTTVTIQGTGFSTTANATMISFGGTVISSPGPGLPAVSCQSVTQCTVASPGGTGTVDVVATVAGQSSPASAADQFIYQPVTVTRIAPNSGPIAGGTSVAITGTGFPASPATPPTVNFGVIAATSVSCSSPTSCTAMSPITMVTGSVDVTVTVQAGSTPQTSNTSGADQFTYVAPATLPSVTGVSPKQGFLSGGTSVTITGTNLAGATSVSFGPNLVASPVCTADGTSCTVLSTGSTATGSVHVQVTANGQTSLTGPGDAFTYLNASATVFAFGITAPKGGMVWVPGALGGHWWSSDHANGFCRQDPMAGAAPFAMNWKYCDNGSIGSPGQAVYDSRPAACQALAAGPCHYIYVPDNAVKSTAVWRLTFDEATEAIVGSPEGMVPLADVRTLKPNGMALGPDGNLYVTDLTELNIRKITGPNGDPRSQTLSIVAVTGDGRGANGTIGFIGNKLYISENRAAAWFDITTCPTAAGPCATTPIPLPAGVFIAGVATDPVHGFVYAADSPGGSPATIWRYNVATGVSSAYLTAGTPPTTPSGTFNCAQTCTRPTDSMATASTFSFAFGIVVDPNNSNLMITEDATAGNRSGRGRAWLSPFLP